MSVQSEDMFNKLLKETERINDMKLRVDIQLYLNSHRLKISTFPASIKYHHSMKCGLIIHTIEVCNLCEELINTIYRLEMVEVNSDYIYAAAILHDIGKIFSYDCNDDSTNFVYKERGMLDHTTAVIIDYENIMGKLLLTQVKLLILSHEGGWSKTGVYPDTIDSAILASADLLSSRVYRDSGWVL